MSEPIVVKLPETGSAKDAVLERLSAARDKDVKWTDGRALCLVFHPGEETYETVKAGYNMFFSENALNPTAFPSLRRFETEVVSMTADIMGGDAETAGNMTSGGTESCMMSVYTAREWARAEKPDITAPEIVMPTTGHPAFDKGAHYFGVKVVTVPPRSDFRADVEAMKAAVNRNTIMMVCSAPQYPHGVVDPISELAPFARDKGILFHVDSCIGGFMLPFVKRLGYPVPDFDFRVPGVTSISIDLHKYGYAAKPASVILFKNRKLRRHMYYATVEWLGGVYGSPTMTGSKPGGAMAAAWAALNKLGWEGYIKAADAVMKTTRRIMDGVNAIPGIYVRSDPEMSIFAIGSDTINIFQVADEMALRGWVFDRGQNPAGIHVTVSYGHLGVADDFLRDLRDSVAAAKKPTLDKLAEEAKLKIAHGAVNLLPEKLVSQLMKAVGGDADSPAGGPKRQAAMYGMIGSLPNRGDLKEVLIDFFDGLYTVKEPDKP